MIIDSTIFASGDSQLILINGNAYVERKRSKKNWNNPEQFCESESNIKNGRETMFLFFDKAYLLITLTTFTITGTYSLQMYMKSWKTIIVSESQFNL